MSSTAAIDQEIDKIITEAIVSDVCREGQHFFRKVADHTPAIYYACTCGEQRTKTGKPSP